MAKKSNKKKTKGDKNAEETKKNMKNILSNKKKQKIKRKKNKAKSKKAKKSEKKEVKQKMEKEEKNEPKNTEKSAVTNGEVELDQAVEDVDRYIIVEAKPSEFQEKYYAVTLNYTNVKNNNNKFYIIQLLQDIHTKKYGVLFRWGRVGKFGQVNFINYNNFEEARTAFMEKLERKILYGYTMIKTEAKIKNKDNEKDEVDKDDDGLERPIANLLRLVFDLKTFNQQMQNIGYDSDKIPLGQLSSEVINEGYKCLIELEKIIEDKNKSNKSNELYDLSSKYYTYIPHNFGMYHMSQFVINSIDKIKKENELLDSIKNIKVVSGVLHSSNNDSKNESDKNKISLKEKLNEFKYNIKYIPKEDIKYAIIEQYVLNSNSIKNSSKIKLNEVFEIEEKNIERNKSTLNIKNSNKKLLWYGASIANFVNILKNGLELPSPQAPIFSYMFGKGIYFSDIAIKSFYNSHPQNNIGLMLLCEVELGNIEERLRADIKLPQTLEKDKNSVKVLGMNYPDEKGNYIDNGVVIPTGKILTNQDDNKKSYFDFNEYIVYNLEQIKIKYITKVQFDKF